MVRHSVPCVVVDVPNIWAPWIKYTLVQADEVIITATPELASLRNTKNMIDHAQGRRAPTTGRRASSSTRWASPKRPEIPVAEFAKALGVEPSSIIPFDAADLRHRREQRPDDRRGRAEVEGGRADRDACRRLLAGAAQKPRQAEPSFSLPLASFRR